MACNQKFSNSSNSNKPSPKYDIENLFKPWNMLDTFQPLSFWLLSSCIINLLFYISQSFIPCLGSQSISTRKRAPSCDLAIEVPRAIATSSHNVAQPGESNDYVSRIVSKLEAGKSSSSKRIFVCPRQPNMTIPKESSVLPISDDQWVAFSVETGSSQ